MAELGLPISMLDKIKGTSMLNGNMRGPWTRNRPECLKPDKVVSLGPVAHRVAVLANAMASARCARSRQSSVPGCYLTQSDVTLEC
jgi:hypothetical protein